MKHISILMEQMSTETIYHGDNYNTTSIEPKLMSNGNNQEGIGIYFATLLSTAKDYGSNVVSINIDTRKFIDARSVISRYVKLNEIVEILNGLWKVDPEAFFYMVSDYIEVSEIDDVGDWHVRELAVKMGVEKVRDFQITLVEAFNVEAFVKLWNEVLPNIHGAYSANSDTDTWYSVINTGFEVTQVTE